jgi:phosphoglycolate phosphatase-like HAD superfamily hydrolase
VNLLVCDLDGTLTRTFAVDEECFVQAFIDVFDVRDLNTQWTEYEHVTDMGVLQQVFRERFNRLPARDDVIRFARHFTGLLADRYSRGADPFSEVPGAASMLTELAVHPLWRVAIATGGMAASAKFKLQKAPLPADDIPIASAEDGPSREAIVHTAVERAKKHYAERQFERIVSVGDAVWDVRTARRLELPFVGVATGGRAARLRDNGATTIIEDFLNYEHCMTCFESAGVPAD